MKKILVIGSTGGIGLELISEFKKKKYIVEGLNSKDLDLNFPEKIFQNDFSKFDIIVNASGHSKGTFKGFTLNDWKNQLSQITVNFISNIFILKHYIMQKQKGKYVWLNSILTEKARPYHSVYVSTKVASKTAIDLIKKEAPHIKVLEAQIGITKTNFRYTNFLGQHSKEEINKMYEKENACSAKEVAIKIIDAIEDGKEFIQIK
jgi:short-subunit dehydrogenase